MSTSAPTSMRVSREDISPCIVKLTVSCSPEQVTSGVRKAIKSLSKRVKIPGFRPGTAPISVLESFLSPEDIDGLSQEETVNFTVKKAIDEEGLEMGGRPILEEVKFNRAAATCEYTIKVPLAPKVTLGEYKGLSVEKYRVEVSDEEIERQLDELRSRNGAKKAVDRGIKVGDNALVNIKLDGDEGDGRNFMVVAGQTFEDLDKALEGMEAEEFKSTTLKFPEGFQEADLAGKEVKCTLNVKSVSAIELPDLDDAFAKSLNLESIDTLKDNVKQYIQSAKEQMSTDMVHERLMEQVVNSSEVHVPDTLWEEVAEYRIRDLKIELEAKSATIEQYAEQNGMTVEQLIAAIRESSKANVERAQIIHRIFTSEGMKVTNQDVNSQFLKIAYENRISESELKTFAKQYAQQIQQEVYTRTMNDKVLILLTEKAQITEVDPPTGSNEPVTRGGRKKKDN